MKKTDQLLFPSEKIGYSWNIAENPVFTIDSIHLIPVGDDWASHFQGVIVFTVSAYTDEMKLIASQSSQVSLTIGPKTKQPIMLVDKKIDYDFDTVRTKRYSLEINVSKALILDGETLIIYLSHELDTDFTMGEL